MLLELLRVILLIMFAGLIVIAVPLFIAHPPSSLMLAMFIVGAVNILRELTRD